MAASYSIRELSADFAVTPRTIRFYEDKGILNPRRRGTTRIFSERDRVRLKLALRGKRIGLSLEEIRNIIDMYDICDGDDTLQLLHLCRKIQQHRAEMLSKMKDIEATLGAMDEVERRCLDTLERNAGRFRKQPSASHIN